MSTGAPGAPGPFDGAIRRRARGRRSGVVAGRPRLARPRRRAPGRHRFAYAIVGLLGAASLVCVGLFLARFWYSHTYHYWFLLWNLVLAWVPFVFAAIAYSLASARRAVLYVLDRRGGDRVARLLPERAVHPHRLPAPREHGRHRARLVRRAHALLVRLDRADARGRLALPDAGDRRARGLGTAAGWAFVIVVAGLGSFGIYLGRFLRWNSWDLVRRPGPLADELLGRVTDPASQPRLLGFTVLFALLFLFIYVAVYIFAKLTKPPAARERA